MNRIKKIVIIGPESTGKSTLSNLLAAHYHAPNCAEYAREYLLKNGSQYSFGNLLTIAKGQLQLEQEIVKKMEGSVPELNEGYVAKSEQTNHARLLFIDTDMYVMKVWCEFVFGQCHAFILNKIVERSYDLYLLCKPDMPWVKDELREYPDLESREKLYHMYKDILINQNTPWVEISGGYTERFDIATRAVTQLFH